MATTAPFWPQRLLWRRSIAELRTSPACKLRNCLTITSPASNRRSPGPRSIRWIAGRDLSAASSNHRVCRTDKVRKALRERGGRL
jgi:hypothetical protein